jgi:hypothetical protein
VPCYGGSWQGCWRHLTCTSVPAGGPGCNDITIGDQGGLTLILAQDRDTAQGSLNLSGVMINVSGSIQTDGTLSLSGNRPSSSDVLSDWRATINDTMLDGTFTWSIVSDPPPPFTPSGRILTDRVVRTTRVDTLLSPAELSLRCR